MQNKKSDNRLNPNSFNKWWRGINSKKREVKKDILNRWLYYATKTVSMRGNHDEQLIVFVIHNRYSKSKWSIPKYQAKKVYDIVNQKQLAFKRETKGTNTLHNVPKGPVVLNKKITKRVIASSGNRLKERGK